MDYDLVVTSPTELLSPEAFPDTTDLNGNAMHQSKEVIDYRTLTNPSSCKTRALVFALIIFVITSIVMASLFAWRMTMSEQEKTTITETTAPPCYIRAVPRKFEKLPQKIEEYLKMIKDKIETNMKKENSSVVLMNIVYHDKVIWELKHQYENNKRKTIVENAPFPVASVTKVITALLVFKLYNDGQIRSLDDPITKYEPNFKIIPYDRSNATQISIRHLISYLSGLPREAPCFPDSDANYCPYNNSVVLKKLSKTKLLFTPGSDFLYGNLQFGVAGHSLSRSYPGGYEKIVHDKILAPMGMQSSFFTLNDTIKRKMYKPRFIQGKQPKIKEWGWLKPAGGLLTTIDDLAKLEMGLFNNSKSKFLRSVLYDEFFSPAYLLPDGKTMLGSSWKITFRKGYIIFEKNGYVYGYDSRVYLNPHLRLAVNVMITSVKVPVSASQVMSELTDLFHEELQQLTRTTEFIPVSNPERFIGVYHTSDVITLAKDDIVITRSKNRKGNSTHHVLALKIQVFNLDLSYIGDNIFEIFHKQCPYFELGINGEKLYFEEQLDPEKKLSKFFIYGIHLRGKATFYRKD